MTMANIALFLHGQGVAKEEHVAKYLDLISVAVSDHTFLPLKYGHIVESLGLNKLSRSDENENDGDQVLAEARAEGYIERELGLEEDSIEELAPAGEFAKSAPRIAFNLISYSVRYLARKTVHDAVLDELLQQAIQHIQEQHLKQKSVVLLAHSLGTVVALDLLHSDLRGYFCKYISLGSPLGMIAKVPIAGKQLLPPTFRKVGVEWIDIAAPDDLIAKVRITPKQGFDGDPLKIDHITANYHDPHGAYFFNKAALSEWVGYLMEA
jgi:hypothetical protein